jgi:hypothetical protein
VTREIAATQQSVSFYNAIYLDRGRQIWQQRKSFGQQGPPGTFLLTKTWFRD